MNATVPSPELAQRAVNALKFLAIDGVEAAKSGHPGLPMGAADFSFVLWSRYLRHDPKDPSWPDRDRFVLSAGHGSMLLYSLLHLAGYDLPVEELKRFRQWASRTPGHPESHLTPGVECTTGPLGQGLATAVGMALAAKMADARFPGLFKHRVWALVSDGDMMEGIAHEAASAAGHLQLGNLTFLYDDNKITLDGNLDESMSEDVGARFEAYGFRVLRIDGHDHRAIADALDAAAAETARPMLICCRTHIGHGAPNKHDTHKVHGEPLGPEEALATRRALGWPEAPLFHVPEDVRALWDARAEALAREHAAWREHEARWLAEHPDKAALYRAMRERAVPEDLTGLLAGARPPTNDATRSLAGAVLQRAAQLVPALVGGDADLGGSTKTPLKDSPKVLPGRFEGRNVRFGIREHAMGAMANGMALYGMFIPFTATFLTFSDYMRGAVRLAALSELQVVHVFTHDSIFLGEDGPTHQSVEHVAALRLIPNVEVWRPADGLECAVAWGEALRRRHGPTELIFSRQKVAELPAGPAAEDVARGAYVVLREEGGPPDVVLLGSGSEVGLCLGAARALHAAGRRARVVSMPCMERFAAQDAAYREAVLGRGTRRVSIEAGRTDPWHRWLGDGGLAIGMDTFGASAPASVLAEKFGFTVPQVVARVQALLG
ncbi:MAG: transketolase [Deltaproteobacteria bacterium]|nr:transketolase [Deltaproteobacteria bacterium]